MADTAPTRPARIATMQATRMPVRGARIMPNNTMPRGHTRTRPGITMQAVRKHNPLTPPLLARDRLRLKQQGPRCRQTMRASSRLLRNSHSLREPLRTPCCRLLLRDRTRRVHGATIPLVDMSPLHFLLIFGPLPMERRHREPHRLEGLTRLIIITIR